MRSVILVLTLFLMVDKESKADSRCFTECRQVCLAGVAQAAILCPSCKCCPQIKCRFCMFGYVLARDNNGCITCRCKWPM